MAAAVGLPARRPFMVLDPDKLGRLLFGQRVERPIVDRRDFADSARAPFVDDLLFSRLKSYDDAWDRIPLCVCQFVKEIMRHLLMRNYFPYGFIKIAQDGLFAVGDRFAQLRLRALVWISQSPYNALAMSDVVAITQTFLTIYALSRNMIYRDMNAPFLESFFNAVKGAALKLCTAVLGEHAMHVLCKKKGVGARCNPTRVAAGNR